MVVVGTGIVSKYPGISSTPLSISFIDKSEVSSNTCHFVATVKQSHNSEPVASLKVGRAANYQVFRPRNDLMRHGCTTAAQSTVMKYE